MFFNYYFYLFIYFSLNTVANVSAFLDVWCLLLHVAVCCLRLDKILFS